MASGVKLKKFLLRYYPPGIILQYERDGQMLQKPVDLLDLTPDVDVEVRGKTWSSALVTGHSRRLRVLYPRRCYVHRSSGKRH
jgi:hypothetical protein